MLMSMQKAIQRFYSHFQVVFLCLLAVPNYMSLTIEERATSDGQDNATFYQVRALHTPTCR